mmetsp:Transcript_10099/g.38261  ORF Transcript_10099/g.38261 Transcript_10099/m.38261 type:complete len:203 (-) Transcript_10099:6280-6888(-)
MHGVSLRWLCAEAAGGMPSNSRRAEHGAARRCTESGWHSRRISRVWARLRRLAKSRHGVTVHVVHLGGCWPPWGICFARDGDHPACWESPRLSSEGGWVLPAAREARRRGSSGRVPRRRGGQGGQAASRPTRPGAGDLLGRGGSRPRVREANAAHTGQSSERVVGGHGNGDRRRRRLGQRPAPCGPLVPGLLRSAVGPSILR